MPIGLVGLAYNLGRELRARSPWCGGLSELLGADARRLLRPVRTEGGETNPTLREFVRDTTHELLDVDGRTFQSIRVAWSS